MLVLSFFMYSCTHVLLLSTVQQQQANLICSCCGVQRKVVSDSLGLVDLVIRLVNSVFNLPDGQVMFYKEFE